MTDYGQSDRGRARTTAADDGATDRRAATAADASAGDSLDASLNDGPTSRSLLQLRDALDDSPRMRALRPLQRALNRIGRDAEDEEPERSQQGAGVAPAAPVRTSRNATGLPDHLKAGVEQLSGFALDDVRVHYNSPKPVAVQAFAYTQGTEIHVAPGQQRHLPHEVWHVVQQMQGRVKPTLQLKGMAINDDGGLEREADMMGRRAVRFAAAARTTGRATRDDEEPCPVCAARLTVRHAPLQRMWIVWTEKEVRRASSFDTDNVTDTLALDADGRQRLRRALADDPLLQEIEDEWDAAEAGDIDPVDLEPEGDRAAESGKRHRSKNTGTRELPLDLTGDEDADENLEDRHGPRSGRALDPEKMFASRIASTETQLVDTLQSANATAGVMVRLPPLVVDPAQFDEAQRQLALQLRGLNALTAEQWLTNLLINRMKTTEQQISDAYGTVGGILLAQKIDALLRENRELAVFLMRAIQSRMEQLCAGAPALVQPAIKDIKDIHAAATAALGAHEVYLEFRNRGGLENMSQLTLARVSGGTGRQRGAGDEKDFRKSHQQGIDLLKQSDPGRFDAKAACLHNPDQCAGGPMEILWHLAHQTALDNAHAWFLAASRSYQRAAALVESYARIPPLTDDGKTIDDGTIDQADEQLSILEDECEQAAAAYLHELATHVGNYEVNSLLGKMWMERTSGDVVNRLHAILKAVLHIPFERLATTPMNVVMTVAPPATMAVSLSAGPRFPDVLNRGPVKTTREPTQKQLRSWQVTKATNAERRLVETKDKMGPQQQTLDDVRYASTKRKAESSTGGGLSIDGLPEFEDLEPEEQGITSLTGRQVAALSQFFGGAPLDQWVSFGGHEYRIVMNTQGMPPTGDNPSGLRLGLRRGLRGG